jgi:hypothetical protein
MSAERALALLREAEDMHLSRCASSEPFTAQEYRDHACWARTFVKQAIVSLSAHPDTGKEDGEDPDTKRLNWLEKNKRGGGGPFRLQWNFRDDHDQSNLRAAIDAARAAQSAPNKSQ